MAITRTIMILFIVFLVSNRVLFGKFKHYNLISVASLIIFNLFTIAVYGLQYYFDYQDYVVDQLHVGIGAIPSIVLSVIIVAILNMVYNILFILFTKHSKL